MIKSMTGFGKATGGNKFVSLVVQIVSLNKNNFDIEINIYPKDFYYLFPVIRDEVKKAVKRGKLTVLVSIEVGNKSKRIQFDGGLAKKLFLELKKWEKDNFGTNSISPDVILNQKDLYYVSTVLPGEENLKKIVKKAVKKALSDLNGFRLKEGRELSNFFVERLKKIRKIIALIKKLMPAAEKAYAKRLKKRINDAGKDGMITDGEKGVFYKMMGIFIEKSGISEEVSRIESHIKQFEANLKKGGSVGKTLNFISQELLREANTMGSKAQDAKIKKLVVDLKSVIEEMKEQVLNVE